MTLHVNIGEAKTRLSQLIAAAQRGEKVVIDRNGEPAVELTAIAPNAEQERLKAERRARLEAFFGSMRGEMDPDFDALPLFTEEELESFESPDF